MNSIPPGIILIIGALLLPALPRRIRPATFLIATVVTFYWLITAQADATVTMQFLDYELMPIRVDRLSLCFGYVFVLITFFGGIFAYHVKDTGSHCAALLYAGSSLGVVFAGDLITLICFWEIMAVSSVYLIWIRRTPKSRGAGMRYLIYHLIGGSLILGGIILHLNESGSILFNQMDGSIASMLILIGFCINAAVPPLHVWLSDAYPEATVTGSVFLSVFTTKAAVYVLIRGFAGIDLLMWAGAIMAVYGVVFAILENDTRRLLSYHIISQVGYMVCGVGIGTAEAINGASAHAFAHILYKALLFMGAGALLHATGKSKLTELGGLAKALPLVLLFYMIAAFSISGVPLFSGFVSKSMVIYAAGLNHEGIIVLLLNLASIGTFASVAVKLPYFAWFGQKSNIKPEKIPVGMYIGMGLTALTCIAIGVYPPLLYNLLPNPVDYHPYTVGHVSEALQLLIGTGIVSLFLIQVGKVKQKATITIDFDWLYRIPVKLAYTVFIAAPSKLFGMAEHNIFRIMEYIEAVGGDPIEYIFRVYDFFTGRNRNIRDMGDPTSYSPDKHRIMVGAIIIIVLFTFIVTLVWSLLAL